MDLEVNLFDLNQLFLIFSAQISYIEAYTLSKNNMARIVYILISTLSSMMSVVFVYAVFVSDVFTLK